MAKNDTEGDIHLYDASNLTFGAGMFVLKAAQLLEEGKTLDEVIKELNIIKEKYCLVFSIDSLIIITPTKAIINPLITFGILATYALKYIPKHIPIKVRTI